MIESLRRSETCHLSLFAVCTFGLGFFMGFAVQLFHPTAPVAVASPAVDAARRALQMNASTTSLAVAITSLFFMMFSFAVLAIDCLKKSERIHLCARALYLVSLITIMVAMNAAVLLFMSRF